STITAAPFTASASPSPVRLFTPELGAAASASCPASPSFLTSLDPMRPVPPITTIFMFSFLSTDYVPITRSATFRPESHLGALRSPNASGTGGPSELMKYDIARVLYLWDTPKRVSALLAQFALGACEKCRVRCPELTNASLRRDYRRAVA